ncbi:hypothetical protein ACCQ12_19685 [Xanthomonas sp. NCPPB 1068]|uniref:hypothetical protein n=1 Tax=Xanthomonas sp. NCPPB 1068 TaxID=487525 RepID=UPI0035593346
MKIITRKDREMLICAPDCLGKALSLLGEQGFVAMLPAYSKEEMDAMLKSSKVLIEFGCKELCFVGDFASQTEDELDILLENSENLSVVTTSYEDENEAIEYLIFAAGAAEGKILVILGAGHGSLNSQLVKAWV